MFSHIKIEILVIVMRDLYFEPAYGKLYEKIENGICENFSFESNLGKIDHMFIKRKIPMAVNGRTYFDIVTPYGYGGPLVIKCAEGRKNELVNEFEKAFQKYCKYNNIVSEFVRFHPIVDNSEDFQSIYNIENIRSTIGTNIHDYENPIDSEFSRSAIKIIRKATNLGLQFKITEKPDTLNSFKEIYYSTMNRNGASEYYYFDDDYFNRCLESFKNNIILVEVLVEDKVIAAGFYFVYGKIIHAHLSGTLKEYLSYSPAYIIKYATAIWAKEHDIALIHYGGGKSNSKDDPLYLFKKKFGKNTEFEFCVGKKIWNQRIYEELNKTVGTVEKTSYFPAYRSKM